MFCYLVLLQYYNHFEVLVFLLEIIIAKKSYKDVILAYGIDKFRKF